MKKARDEDIEREIRTHLDLEAEERMAEGMTEAEARDAARRAFGNVARTREDVRAVWTHRAIEELVQDVRYALRSLRRSPTFAILAVVTIALGVGANTAMFSVVNAAVLRPPGYPESGRLRFMTTRFSDGGEGAVSPAEYFELGELSQSFSVIGAFTTGGANLSARDRPRRARRARVNAELLEALAVPPARGRWFTRNETSAGGPAVVMLSHDLWKSAFDAREDLLGRSVEIDGVAHEVIAIMPAGFDLMDERIDLWLPLQVAPFLRQFRASHFLSVIGRLKSGVSAEQAEAELASLIPAWGARSGASGHVFEPGGHVMQMQPVFEEMVGPTRRAFWMLQAGVALVLLIACANLANLLMVRAEVRGREIAVRTALGAGPRRLLAQFVAEGLVLLVLGGALGLLVAWAGVRVVTAAYPESVPRVAQVGIDPAVLGFTLLVAAATGVVFGLVPLRYLSDRVAGRLLTSRTGGSQAARPWMRRALVAGEVALAVLLVASAGLMVRTVVNLMRVDAGFDRAGLVTFGIALPEATYPSFVRRARMYHHLVDGLETMPGIAGAAAVSGLPPLREHNGYGTDIEDYTAPPDVSDWVNYYQTVTNAYFETAGIRIVQGRDFEPTDAAGAPVVVVNEAFVRTFWPNLDPIGRRLRPRFGDATPWVTVVGVAKDVKQGGVDQATGTEVYFLLDQLPRIFPAIRETQLGDWSSDGSMHIVLRSTLPAAALHGSIANLVHQADPSLPIIRLRDMDDVFSDAMRRPRMLMQLLAGFAALAVLLAAIGTYGVLSYTVTQQRREIGIRMALGADRAAVLGTVMGHGLKLTSVGLVVGLAAALALTQLLDALLFGVRPNDPATLAAVAALIMAVAAAASLMPAVRATRVDPLVALRAE